MGGRIMPGRFVELSLEDQRDNVGATSSNALGDGAFNVWRNSFPAEHLPAGGLRRVGSVPFQLPAFGEGVDNVRCAGQHLPVPAGWYDWLHLLAAAERRAEDVLWLHFQDGAVESPKLRISDFWAAPAAFGELEAFSTPAMHYPHHVQNGVSARMWSQRVPVARRGVLVGVTLPRNIAIHIFAATLENTPRENTPRENALRDGHDD